jgi:hypothetical protein
MPGTDGVLGFEGTCIPARSRGNRDLRNIRPLADGRFIEDVNPPALGQLIPFAAFASFCAISSFLTEGSKESEEQS